jgi:hypothetical protein
MLLSSLPPHVCAGVSRALPSAHLFVQGNFRNNVQACNVTVAAPARPCGPMISLLLMSLPELQGGS